MDENDIIIPPDAGEEQEERKWLYYLNLDDDGYVMSVGYQPEIEESEEPEPEGIHIVPMESIDDYDFTGERLHAYRWDEQTETLIFDNTKYAELIAEQAKEQTQLLILELTAQLRQSDSIILEALEGLLSATTLTGFLSALIAAARNVHDTIVERAGIREQIENLRREGSINR